jgi:CxxC-x17-CxxC domain-containing protein
LSYADRNLKCRECGQDFVFTAGEQEFHASKGFRSDPSRCQDCRIARRAARGDSSGAYSARNSNLESSGPRDFGTGGSGRSDREMFSATCSECGKEARVPFQPRGDRPVYCSDCYSKQRSSSPSYR